MTTMTATYSPDDNKLRLYASTRLDAETYARVKAAGFIWAPKQDLFVAPMWTPERADLLLDLCGDIEDDDSSLTERAADRAERFTEYREHRIADAEREHAAVSAIADAIPLGQPILVGHHSERHARRDAQRIENGMRRAVRMWDTAEYWKARAAGAIRHAKYKERPDVRARRIKTLEADRRKQQRIIDNGADKLRLWSKMDAPAADGSACTPELARRRAIAIANVDGGYFRARHEFTRPTGEVYHVGPLSLWAAAGGNIHGQDPESVAIATPDAIREQARQNHAAMTAHAARWIAHFDHRLDYERAMLADAGGTIAQRTGPEKGGAVQCWTTGRSRDRWATIQKVNRVSVTILDSWDNGGKDFPRTIKLEELTAVMPRAAVDAARQAGRLAGETPRGFILLPETTPPPPAPPTPERPAMTDTPTTAAHIAALRDALRTGVQVVAVPHLFPTPNDVAEQVIDLADIRPGHRVLEPSAGTGALIGAMGGRMFGADVKYGRVHAVEVNGALCHRLRADFPLTTIHQADFLQLAADDFGGTFDRIVMNPPFDHGADIEHIEHARAMLAPSGRLVAICANGPRQQARLRPLAAEWIDLPPDTFVGTSVRAAVLVIDAGTDDDRAQHG